jgi:glycosyltransferase involved in cell wall biosynthesis
VGRMRYYKGLTFAIDALAQLPTEIKLVLVGSGAIQRELIAHVEQAGLTNRVVWLGDCADADIAALHALARIFVFPSHLRSEAFGLSLLEALAAGVPAISCEIGTGTSFVNQHKRTGLVVPPANPHALAHAIQTLWYDEPLRQHMSQSARTWVAQNFHADQMIDDVYEVYHDVSRI